MIVEVLKRCQRALTAICLVVMCPLLLANSLSDQRQRYTLALKALDAGATAEYTRLRSSLKDYPLAVYLDYAALQASDQVGDTAALTTFLARAKTTPLARRVRHQWLRHYAAKQRWAEYLQFYRNDSNTTLRCHAGIALLAQGKPQAAFKLAKALWPHGKSRPDACNPLFQALRKAGKLTGKDIWERFELATHAGKIDLARYLQTLLPKAEQPLAKRWIALRKAPRRVAELAPSQDRPGHRLTRYAVIRLARQDAQAGATLWSKLANQHKAYSVSLRAELRRRIGISLATAHAPNAYQWLQAISDKDADKSIREWRVRSALRHAIWPAVRTAIARLTPSERATTRWRYWLARADNQLGRRSHAAKAYAAIASRRDYYGFLSADRANLDYAINHQPIAASNKILAPLRKRDAYLRARELLHHEQRIDTRREWFAMLGRLSTAQQEQAGLLAHQLGWHAGAILTLGRAKRYGDAVIRFPIAHTIHVQGGSKRWDVDSAWVFAVLRQESAFMQAARSPVGARGLMQIMPATGKQIARRLKLRWRGASSLLDPARNILFGSSYLRQLLDELDDHPALVTAGYNAGPHRSIRWLPAVPIEADQWIETIPFKETRRYVQSVMAYEVIYRWRLQQAPVRLSARLPLIPAALPAKAATR